MALCGIGHTSSEGLLEPYDSRLPKVNSQSHIAMQQADSKKISTRERIKNRLQKFFGIKWRGTPDDPLIPPQLPGNVFHDQALVQLVAAYESLQLGDSREAIRSVYDVGERIFGRALFERAVRDGGLTSLSR